MMRGWIDVTGYRVQEPAPDLHLKPINSLSEGWEKWSLFFGQSGKVRT